MDGGDVCCCCLERIGGKGGGMGGRERCNIRVESRLMVDGNLE